CLLTGRVAGLGAARVLAGRRSRRVVGVVVALVGVVLAVVATRAVRAGSLGIEPALERVPAVAGVLSWTPWGAAWSAPDLVDAGRPWLAVAKLGVAAGGVALGLVVWGWLLRRTLVRPVARSGGVRRHSDRILVGRPA